MKARQILFLYLFLLTISHVFLLLLINKYGTYDNGFLVIVILSYFIYFLYIKGFRAIKILFSLFLIFMALVMVLLGIEQKASIFYFLGILYFVGGIHILISKKLKVYFNKIRPLKQKESLIKISGNNSTLEAKSLTDEIIELDLNLYPEILDRLKASFIDSMVILLLMFVFTYFLNLLKIESGLFKGASFFLIFSYEPIMTSINRTLGQRAINIEVVKNKNEGERINILQSYLRYLSKMTLGIFSIITVTSTHQKRAIHDFISGSLVIKNKQNSQN